MTNVIDFIARKEEQQLTKKQRAIECSFDHPLLLQKFIDEQSLQVKDHQLFLAFLLYLQQHQIDALTIFRDVFSMKRTKFEYVYQMKWWAIVQLGLTFLAILREKDMAEYTAFFEKFT